MPPRPSLRRLPDTVRLRLEVATAMAWENLVDAHVDNATEFVELMEDQASLEEALTRYLREMDLTEAMAVAIRTRALVSVEAEERAEETAGRGASDHDAGTSLETDGEEDGDGWRRFRPDVMVRGVRQRKQRSDEEEMRVLLALARAEENVITTHVDSALGFAALLGDHMPLDRTVQQYLGAVSLTGGRAQTVHQR
ncbi:MAG: hypothetical protein WEB88_10090, partial [Gemmatimonadota bacterium]